MLFSPIFSDLFIQFIAFWIELFLVDRWLIFGFVMPFPVRDS